jgi:ribose 5-phosphate isomerase B
VRIGIAADHAGFDLKKSLSARLRAAGYDVLDCGAFLQPSALCGSGAGASVCCNEVAGVRAALVPDTFSAPQPFGSS